MAKKHILLIDDDIWMSELMAKVLRRHRYTVSHAANAIEGIERIDEARPDMIVLDMIMPGPNGIVLLHELQSYSDTSSIPVIACTNSAAELPLGMLAPYGVKHILDKTTMNFGDIVAAARRYA